ESMKETANRIGTGTFAEQRVEIVVRIDVAHLSAKGRAQQAARGPGRKATDEQLVPDARPLRERRDEGAERRGPEGHTGESTARGSGQSRKQILPPCGAHRRVTAEELVAAVARQR